MSTKTMIKNADWARAVRAGGGTHRIIGDPRTGLITLEPMGSPSPGDTAEKNEAAEVERRMKKAFEEDDQD